MALAVAAALVMAASRLEGESIARRWRVTGIGLGVLLPWLLHHAIVGSLGAILPVYPWWDAPEAGLAVLPLVAGGLALLRGRTWGVAALMIGAIAVFLVEVPANEMSCFGPQGHPFDDVGVRMTTVLASVTAAAPWLAPVLRALRGAVSVRGR